MLHPSSLLLCVSGLVMKKSVHVPTRRMRQFNRLHLRELSRQARKRLAWFDYYDRCGNVSLTCRHFGISRSTFYDWKQRFNRRDLSSLEDRSSRPRRCRQRTWTSRQVLAIKQLREQHPTWGKAKLQRLLQRDWGMTLSVSKVGRILTHLKRTGQLREPLRRTTARRRTWKRHYATRKPRAYQAHQPGDIVQLDTVDIRPERGVVLKQFTAVDVVSRWSVALLAHDATAASAVRALAAIRARMPFPVRAIQVDGGSEFMAEFEQDCKDRRILLFELPPRSPKLNGRVERANRTYREEFYDCTNAPPTVTGLSPGLLSWERLYNTVRPHQALGYLTPAEFLAHHYPEVSATC